MPRPFVIDRVVPLLDAEAVEFTLEAELAVTGLPRCGLIAEGTDDWYAFVVVLGDIEEHARY
jgi:hypothetical protein